MKIRKRVVIIPATIYIILIASMQIYTHVYLDYAAKQESKRIEAQNKNMPPAVFVE